MNNNSPIKKSLNKKALIVVTSHGQLGNTGKKTGWYLPEVTHIYFPLVEAGFAVDFASPQGGAAPMDPKSYNLEDPFNRRFIEEPSLLAAMAATLRLSAIEPADYALVAFAGGHGTMWDFPGLDAIDHVTRVIYENGGIVAAVCHGPAALVDVKLSSGKYLIDGKAVSAFTNSEEAAVGLTDIVPLALETRLKERGARFHSGSNWQDTTLVSERLVTGQNPQSALALGHKLVELAKAIGL